jgi:hypothetical protein
MRRGKWFLLAGPQERGEPLAQKLERLERLERLANVVVDQTPAPPPCSACGGAKRIAQLQFEPLLQRLEFASYTDCPVCGRGKQ